MLPSEAEEPTGAVRARPLLALNLKATLLPAHRTQVVGQDAATDVLAARRRAGLVAMVVADVALVVGGDFWRAVTELVATPTTALLIYGLLVTSAVLHEVGHAAACRYGGAEPGDIGVGIYIVFPAFYTDVSDSYRLGRGGRVRTDLGGLYFNALTVVAFALLYVASGSGLWLLTALALQLQMLQQLIPVVRFDGYYVLVRPGRSTPTCSPGSDRCCARSGRGTSRSARHRAEAPGAPVRDRLGAGRRAAADGRADVGHLAPPDFVATGRAAIRLQQLVFDVAWERRDWAAMALAVVSIALILVPLAGLTVVLWRTAATSTDSCGLVRGQATAWLAEGAPHELPSSRTPSVSRPCHRPSCPRRTSPTRSCTPRRFPCPAGVGVGPSTRAAPTS